MTTEYYIVEYSSGARLKTFVTSPRDRNLLRKKADEMKEKGLVKGMTKLGYGPEKSFEERFKC